jgi:hypothetical protein
VKYKGYESDFVLQIVPIIYLHDRKADYQLQENARYKVVELLYNLLFQYLALQGRYHKLMFPTEDILNMRLLPRLVL